MSKQNKPPTYDELLDWIILNGESTTLIEGLCLECAEYYDDHNDDCWIKYLIELKASGCRSCGSTDYIPWIQYGDGRREVFKPSERIAHYDGCEIVAIEKREMMRAARERDLVAVIDDDGDIDL